MISNNRVIFSCIFHIPRTAAVAAVRDTDNGLCHLHRTVLPALCGAGVCLSLFLLLNVVCLLIYAKLGLVVGMAKQTSDGKEVDIVKC